MRVVVLGIGNILMQDEGVGVHAAERLRERFDLPPDVELVDGGTAGMELLPELDGTDHLIVMDAVRAGREPGSIVRLAGDDVPAFFKTKLSPHQISLSDILAALAFKGAALKSVVVIGVQPISFDLDMALSPAIAARLDEVVDMAVAELAALGLPARPRS